VLVADAVELANQIIGQAEQLVRRRADLDALNRLLVGENRRLNRSPAPLPAPITRALYPERQRCPRRCGDRLAQGLPGSARGPRRRALLITWLATAAERLPTPQLDSRSLDFSASSF
jgi:hypothetical protein